MRPLLIAIVLTLCGCGDEYKLPFAPKFTYKVRCVTITSELELVQSALDSNFDLMLDILTRNKVVADYQHFCELVKDVQVRVYNKYELFCKDKNGEEVCFSGYDSPAGGVQLSFDMEAWLHEYFHHFDTVWMVMQEHAHAHWERSGYNRMSDEFYNNMRQVYVEKPEREDP